VRERSVYGREDINLPSAADALIDIAKTHRKLTIRKAAIYCLGDSDDPRALQALIQIIKNNR